MGAAEMLTAESRARPPLSALDSGALSRVGSLGQLGGLLSAPPPVTVARAGDTSEHEPRPCLPAAAPRLVKVRTRVAVTVERMTSEVLVPLGFCSWAASLGSFLALIFISSPLSPPTHLSCRYTHCSRVYKTSGQTRA